MLKWSILISITFNTLAIIFLFLTVYYLRKYILSQVKRLNDNYNDLFNKLILLARDKKINIE